MGAVFGARALEIDDGVGTYGDEGIDTWIGVGVAGLGVHAGLEVGLDIAKGGRDRWIDGVIYT